MYNIIANTKIICKILKELFLFIFLSLLGDGARPCIFEIVSKIAKNNKFNCNYIKNKGKFYCLLKYIIIRKIYQIN